MVFFPDSEPVISSTSFAIRALKSVEDITNNITIKYTISAGVEWLLLNRNSDFGWGIYPNMPSKSCSTALALAAIIDCHLNLNVIKTDIDKGIEIIKIGQQNNGSWQDIIERRAGLTIIRIGSPYCLITLLKYKCNIYDIFIQKGIRYITSNIIDGKSRYQDSDIVTWSTRDILLALAELRKNIMNYQVLEIFDRNIELDKKILRLEQKQKIIEKNFDDRLKEEKKKYDNDYKNQIDNLNNSNNLLRNVIIFFIFVLFGFGFISLQSYTFFQSDEKIGIAAALIALWGSIVAIIKKGR